MAISNISGSGHNRTKMDLQKWIRQFNVENAYNTEKENILNTLNTTIQDLNNVSLLTIDLPSFNYKSYKDNLQMLVRIRAKLLNVQIWIAATVCAFNKRSTLSYISNDISQLLKALNEAKSRFRDYQNIIKFNMANDPETITKDISLLYDILTSQL
jgi:hypothetical protein